MQRGVTTKYKKVYIVQKDREFLEAPTIGAWTSNIARAFQFPRENDGYFYAHIHGAKTIEARIYEVMEIEID